MSAIFSLALSAGLNAPGAAAQTASDGPRVSACIPAGQMLERILEGDVNDLPRYREGIGALIQKQHPKTRMYLQAKYREVNDRTLGICQYTSHVGMVAAYVTSDVYADASDGECGPRYCVGGAYWRKEWAESSEADDKPGLEHTYVCMKDRDGIANPSGACGFSIPE